MVDEVRRGRRRRPIAGRSSTSTHDGVRQESEDLDEDLVEPVENTPEGINRQVEAMAVTLPIPSEAQSQTIEGAEDFTPQNRMQDVRTRSSSYEREYRLKLLHRMLMRQVPLDKIASELGVSVFTVQRDRKELYKRLRHEASQMDMNELIGNTMGFYNEVQGMALRTASNNKTPLNLRMAALRTALSSKNDSHRFLQAAGVFDVLNFQSGEDVGGNDIEKLVALTESMMSDEDDMLSLADDLGVDTDVEEDTEEDMEQHQRLF